MNTNNYDRVRNVVADQSFVPWLVSNMESQVFIFCISPSVGMIQNMIFPGLCIETNDQNVVFTMYGR